jgi:hypothetical protein
MIIDLVTGFPGHAIGPWLFTAVAVLGLVLLVRWYLRKRAWDRAAQQAQRPASHVPTRESTNRLSRLATQESRTGKNPRGAPLAPVVVICLGGLVLAICMLFAPTIRTAANPGDLQMQRLFQWLAPVILLCSGVGLVEISFLASPRPAEPSEGTPPEGAPPEGGSPGIFLDQGPKKAVGALRHFFQAAAQWLRSQLKGRRPRKKP